MAVLLAMVALIKFFKRRSTVKFNSDDYLRAELIETDNKGSLNNEKLQA